MYRPYEDNMHANTTNDIMNTTGSLRGMEPDAVMLGSGGGSKGIVTVVTALHYAPNR